MPAPHLPRRTSCLAIAALTLVLAPRPGAAADWMVLDPGQGAVPLAGSGANELSGLTWLGGNDFLAVSDNGGRLFPLTIDLDTADGDVISAMIEAPTVLAGNDLEGVAYQPSSGNLFVSDESGPAIRIHALPAGEQVGSVSLPPVFAHIRPNLSLEALAWDAAGFLWTANEEALSVDGPVSSLTAGTTIRLQRFDAALAPAGQWAYVTDPLPGDFGPPGRDVEVSGVPELIVLADGTLLALERALGDGVAIRHRLYQVDVAAATDTSALPSLAGVAVTPAGKTLLWERNVLLTNLEGGTVGPPLADGASSLLLVSDNGGGLNQVLYPLSVRPLVCGDGLVGGSEQCDDGNTESGDGCDASCVVEVCGDGVVNAGGAERCDDGNSEEGDGCDAACALERPVLKCQETVAKAGRTYAEGRAKALQRCRDQLNKGKILYRRDDPETPIAGPEACVAESRTAKKIERTEKKARSLIERKCSDATLGLLAACAATVDGLVAADLGGGCLLESHASTTDGLIDDRYGGMLPEDDKERRRCQEAIGKGGAKLLGARLRALQTCRNQFNKGRSLYRDRDKNEPIVGLEECALELRAAKKLTRAGAQLRKAVTRRCDDTGVAALGGICATTVDALVSADGASGCLVDGTVAAVDVLLEAQY